MYVCMYVYILIIMNYEYIILHYIYKWYIDNKRNVGCVIYDILI